MAEKRARKDVKKLSAKVDAFIRNVDKKSGKHSKRKPVKPAHHTHHHAVHHAPEHREHHHTPRQHQHHEHSHQHHENPHPQHHEHTHHIEHHTAPHHNPEHHSHHMTHHTHHTRSHPHVAAELPASSYEDDTSDEKAIHEAVVTSEPELPPMPIPPKKEVPHMPMKQHIKIKKSIPVSHSQPQIRNEHEIAERFASQIHKKFTTLIKATVLFGSQAKHTAVASSDIDIVIIVDDASVNWDLELVAWYREELGKLVAANKYAHELHVNTIKLTTWWQDLIAGDPVVLNILRYGEALIDIAGFFKPLKALLQQGKIHSTPESVYNALQRAPMHLSRSRASELGAIEGVYWTMVDSAQAALITAGQLPPSPEHMTAMLKETFVDKGLMKGDFVYWFRDCYALHKAIIHGHVTTLKGADIDVWQQRAEQFMKKMTDIIDHLLSTK